MPVIAMVMTGTLIYSTFIWSALPSIIAAVVAVGTGLPAYYLMERQNKNTAK